MMYIIRQSIAAALFLAAISFAGCEDDSGEDEPVKDESIITMTTAKEGEVKFTVGCLGDAVVDWGDGTAPETVNNECVHTFSGTTAHTITIKGESIDMLACERLELTALDVSKSTALTRLWCTDNRLTSLDVSKNTALKDLDCFSNRLTSLDVSKNIALTHLNCGWNNLTVLDVTKNTALTNLSCGSNELTSLDVTKNTALINLMCEDIRLTTLDVTKNTALKELYCDHNQLTSLDVTNNTALTSLYCHTNRLTAEGLNALFGTLPGNAGSKLIVIGSNPGAGACDRSIATAKGWTVRD